MRPLRFTFLTAAVFLWSTGCHASPSSAPQASGFSSAPAGSSANIQWVRYTDSAEGAFSMDVPVGWQVLGGMYRFGFFDVRWMMEARSLDGKVAIRIDDPNVPPYVLPGPHSGPAGHAAIRPHMFQMVVEDYQDARPYADTYARRRFSSVCTALTPRAADWTPTMPADWQAEAGARVTQASVAYGCASSAGSRLVAVFARSTLHAGGQGLWQVDPIISIIATPEALARAEAMTQHMIDSWQVSPAWQQFQQRMTNMGLAQMTAQFNQFLQQMQAYDAQRRAAMNQQVSQFESRQNAQAQQVSDWGEILTGLTTVSDPQTGTQFQVFSGPHANYWSNGNGVKVNSTLSPGPDFYQLSVVGP
jgi:hypothetical protein